MGNPAWKLSARGAVEALRTGAVSPREMLDAVRDRVETVDPSVNALPTRCFDRAERAADVIAAVPPERRGVLAGLPVPIKDSYPVAGVRTTYGSLAYADHVPNHSDFVVEAIEAAGGIIYAKSNTPEFEAGANTFNDVFGRTLNPWNTSRSAGGSSGGAAVAVATGMAFLAQGSDFACSLRYPAAFCGIVGVRPSPGVVPQGPSALPLQVLSVVGPLARDVADAALGLDAMARFDPRDPLTQPRGEHSYLQAALTPLRAGRAAYSADLGIATVDDEIRTIVGLAVGRLVGGGLALETVDPPLEASEAAFMPLRAYQFAALRRDALLAHRDKLKPEVVWNIEMGLDLTAADLAAAEARRAALRLQFLAFLDVHEFLIAPTAPVEPNRVEDRYVTEISGKRLETYLDWLALGYAITITGCPAISIPCGRTQSGLPVGLQIVGRPYGEHRLLSFAAWCESALGAGLGEPIDPVSGT